MPNVFILLTDARRGAILHGLDKAHITVNQADGWGPDDEAIEWVEGRLSDTVSVAG